MNLLERTFSGNTLLAWSFALGVTAGEFVAFYYFKHVLLRRLAAYGQKARTPVAGVACRSLVRRAQST